MHEPQRGKRMTETDRETEARKHLLRWAQLTCAGEVASIVAHDINNAVTGVMSYTELAQMDLPSWSESGPHLEKALDQARRISALANRLLALSHESVPYPAPLDLQESLETACSLVQRRLEKDHIVFERILEVEQVLVVADPDRLLQCWLSLIFVARGALLQAGDGQGCRLCLTASRCSGDRAQIQIEAEGIGLPRLPLEENVAALAEEGDLAAREHVLYAAVLAHVGGLGGMLHAQQTGEKLILQAELPIGS